MATTDQRRLNRHCRHTVVLGPGWSEEWASCEREMGHPGPHRRILERPEVLDDPDLILHGESYRVRIVWELADGTPPTPPPPPPHQHT